MRDTGIAIFVCHACPQTFSSTSQVSRWRDPVAPVFAKAYIKLALPKNQMISMAKLRPEWTLALRPMAISESTSIWSCQKSIILEIPKLVCLYRRSFSNRWLGWPNKWACLVDSFCWHIWWCVLNFIRKTTWNLEWHQNTYVDWEPKSDIFVHKSWW